MKVFKLPQTKCLPGQHAIHVKHGWCEVQEAIGRQRVCLVEDGADSFEFSADLSELRAVDPMRDMEPAKLASVSRWPGRTKDIQTLD
jgi:hypothetical protein